MIILETITNFLEAFLLKTISLILHTSLNICKEIFKFVLILVLIYYFAFWTFRLWHTDLEYDTKTFNLEYDAKTLNSRIFKPDQTGSLAKKTPSLIEQLEIEAEFEVNKQKFVRLKPPDIVAKAQLESETEFEVNKNKFVKLKPAIASKEQLESEEEFAVNENKFVGLEPDIVAKEQLDLEPEFEVNKKKFVRLKPPDIVGRDSDEGAIPKIEFISLVEHKQTTTSRPTQTKKTSLGKKSKLRDKNVQNETHKRDKRVKTVKIYDELSTHDD